MHDAVNQAIDRNRCPKDVIAQFTSATLLRAKRNKFTMRIRRDSEISIEAVHGYVDVATMISRKVWL